MTRAEFDSIVRDVAVAVLPKTSKGTMNEFLFTLNEELVSNGLELEDGDEGDVRDDDDEDEE
jgi:hypothetical protein